MSVALDRKCDTLVESSVVHLVSVGQVGPGYEEKHPLLVSFLVMSLVDSRRHGLPKSELENLSYPLYAPIYH